MSDLDILVHVLEESGNCSQSEKCELCNGEGGLYATLPQRMFIGVLEVDGWYGCPNCEGSGEQPEDPRYRDVDEWKSDCYAMLGYR